MFVHWFLYIILHSLITLYNSIHRCIKYVLNFEICRIHSVTKLRNAAKSITRLPIHLGIVLGEENFSFTDLANMILWSSVMNINCLSIYDVYGKFQLLLLNKIHITLFEYIC